MSNTNIFDIENFVTKDYVNGKIIKDLAGPAATASEASANATKAVEELENLADAIKGGTDWKSADGNNECASGFAGYSTGIGTTLAQISEWQGETNNTLAGVITKANANEASVSQIVEAVGEDGKVNAASIVTAVNESGSEISIDANKVNINGQTTFSSLFTKGTTTIDGSKITAGTITADRIRITDSITFGDIPLKTERFYLVTDSNVDVPAADLNTWTKEYSSLSRGASQYIWMKEVITRVNDQGEEVEESHITCITGDHGSDGKDGVFWITDAWVDLSNTATYNENSYYPVIGTVLESINRIKVVVKLDSGTTPSWSTHYAGFSVLFDITTERCGWGTTSGKAIINFDDYSFCNISPVSYKQLINGSVPVLYLRGGGKYKVATDYNCTWTPYSSDYTWYHDTPSYRQTAPVLPASQGRPKVVGDYSLTGGTSVTSVFNELTSNGNIKGFFRLGNDLYINANYIKTGTIDADRISSNSITAYKLATDAIKSRNYIDGQQGSYLNLENGTFDSPNFKIDENGNVAAGSFQTANANISNFSNIQLTGDLSVSGNILGNTSSKHISIYDAYVKYISNREGATVIDTSYDADVGSTSFTATATLVSNRNGFKITVNSPLLHDETFNLKFGYYRAVQANMWYDVSVTIKANETEATSYDWSAPFYRFLDPYFTSTGNSKYTFTQTEASDTGILGIAKTIVPMGHNSLDLGRSTQAWKNIYSSDGTIKSSDRNIKRNIENLPISYDKLFDTIEPKRYKVAHSESNRYHIGYIAQEIKNSILTAGLTTEDFAGYCDWEIPGNDIKVASCGLRYDEFIALNTWQIQKLKKRVSYLEDKCNNLEERLAVLEESIKKE